MGKHPGETSAPQQKKGRPLSAQCAAPDSAEGFRGQNMAGSWKRLDLLNENFTHFAPYWGTQVVIKFCRPFRTYSPNFNHWSRAVWCIHSKIHGQNCLSQMEPGSLEGALSQVIEYSKLDVVIPKMTISSVSNVLKCWPLWLPNQKIPYRTLGLCSSEQI